MVTTHNLSDKTKPTKKLIEKSISFFVFIAFISVEGIQLARKKKQKCASHKRLSSERATRANEKWSMDCVMDRFENGKVFRILTTVDQYTREWVVLHVGSSLRGEDVARCLNQVLQHRSEPGSITVGNGFEFYSQAMECWVYRNQVELDFIRRVNRLIVIT